jgi:hypothetical protein
MAGPINIMAGFIDLTAQFAPLVGGETAGAALRIAMARRIFVRLGATVEGRPFGTLMRRAAIRRRIALLIRFGKHIDAAEKQNHTQQYLSHAHNKFCFPNRRELLRMDALYAPISSRLRLLR